MTKLVRKNHKPTRATRVEVTNLKMFGYSNKKIANLLGISVRSLKKHYLDDLDDAKTRLERKAAAGLEAKLEEGDMTAIGLVWKNSPKAKTDKSTGTKITINNGPDLGRLKDMLKEQAKTLKQDTDGIYKDIDHETND